MSTPATDSSLRTAIVQASRALAAGDTTALGQWCLQFCTTWTPPAAAALVELAPTGHPAEQWAITASDKSVLTLCELDLYTHAGPCRECLVQGEAITIDLSHPPPRWERFAGHARHHGFFWSLAQPLHLGGALIGAIQLYGTTPDLSNEEDVSLANALAGIAAGLRFQDHLLQQRGVEVGQLHTALTSRVVIEQAKGILAERHSSDLQQAFESLRSHARSHHQDIHDLARNIIDGQDI